MEAMRWTASGQVRIREGRASRQRVLTRSGKSAGANIRRGKMF